jgi:hypothetical protein
MIFHPRRFTLALFAQIVFCLVAAPILSAERWAAVPPAPPANQKHDASRDDSRPVIRLAFDASDVRPEEVSGAEQRRGNSGPRNGQSTGSAANGGKIRFSVLDTPLVEWDDAFFCESNAAPGSLDRLPLSDICGSGPACPYAGAEDEAFTFGSILSRFVMAPQYHVDPAAWYASVERAFHPLTLCLFAPQRPAPYFIRRLERFATVQPTGPPGL